MKWVIWKRKPWRDGWFKWRKLSPEFPNQFDSLREALRAKRERKNDGAQTIVMPTFHLTKRIEVLEFAWRTKCLERLRGEFVLGISVAYDKDIYQHEHLCIAFLAWGLYLRWEW